MELVYTTSAPTEPGYYWYRRRKNTVPVVVWVYDSGYGLVIDQNGRTFVDSRISVDSLKGEWAGPIPLPKEREA